MPDPWSTAVPDWRARIMEGRSLVPDLPLFKAQAAKASRIFGRLKIPDIPGQPTMTEACGPWFFPIVETLFGCYDEAAHRRFLQEFFLLVPKGNSKSSYGGALMLTAAIMNDVPDAEFDFIAPTMKIANIAFSQAAGTLRADPELEKLFSISPHQRQIVHRTKGTLLSIKAADTDVITGGKAAGTMIDETHVFAQKSNAQSVFMELRGALGKRPDGFLLQTTTQSKMPPAGVFKAELERARVVRDGTWEAKDADGNLIPPPPLLAVLYELPEEVQAGDDWKQPKLWPLVNPNMGRSVRMDFLHRELAQAQTEGADKLALLASQHWNIEIGLRLRADRWAGADFWEAAADDTLDLDELLARSEVVTIGVDAGGADDLMGFAVIGRERDTHDYLLWNRAFCTKKVLKIRKDIAPTLKDFANDGDLIITPTKTVAAIAVANLCVRINNSGLLAAEYGIGLDTVGAKELPNLLAARGLQKTEDKGPVCGIRQGYHLNGDIEGIEWRLEDGTLSHAGQRLMNWCVGNARLELKGSAKYITKQAAGVAKIDPLTATFNAYSLMARNPPAPAASLSPWENPEFKYAVA